MPPEYSDVCLHNVTDSTEVLNDSVWSSYVNSNLVYQDVFMICIILLCVYSSVLVVVDRCVHRLVAKVVVDPQLVNSIKLLIVTCIYHVLLVWCFPSREVDYGPTFTQFSISFLCTTLYRDYYGLVDFRDLPRLPALVTVIGAFAEEYWKKNSFYATIFIIVIEVYYTGHRWSRFIHFLFSSIPFPFDGILHALLNLSIMWMEMGPSIVAQGYWKETKEQRKKRIQRLYESEISSKDFNPKVTRYNVKGNFQLYGFTKIGNVYYKFPSSCSRATLINFIVKCEEQDPELFGRLKCHGILPQKWKREYVKVLPSIGPYEQPIEESVHQVTPLGAFEDEADPLGFFTKDDAESGERLVGQLAKILLIVNAFVHKDITAMSLIAVQHATELKLVSTFMGNEHVSLIDYFSDFFSEAHDWQRVFMLSIAPEVTAQGLVDDVMSVIPSELKHSPLIMKTIAFVTFISVAQFTQDSYIAKHFLSRINFRNITELSVSAILIGQITREIYLCLERYKNGQYWLGLSKDTAFIHECEALVEGEVPSLTEEETGDMIRKLEDLMISRDNLRDNAEILKFKEKIRVRIRELVDLNLVNKPRVPPVVLFLTGPPGCGKTSLIESTMNALAEANGFARKRGDTVFYMNSDKYPVEAMPRSDAAFLVMNDIKSNFSNDNKQGLLPFDTVMQQIVDSTPLQFPQAFNKGQIFYNLKFVIITSNYENFLMPESPMKLVRRFNNGVMLKMGFKNDVDYDTAANLTQGARNELIRFTVLKSSVSKNVLSFNPTANPVVLHSYQEYFDHVTTRLSAALGNNAVSMARFSADNCKCGVARSFHVVRDSYMQFSEKCDVQGNVPYVPPPSTPSLPIPDLTDAVSRVVRLEGDDPLVAIEAIAVMPEDKLAELDDEVLIAFSDYCISKNKHLDQAAVCQRLVIIPSGWWEHIHDTVAYTCLIWFIFALVRIFGGKIYDAYDVGRTLIVVQADHLLSQDTLLRFIPQKYKPGFYVLRAACKVNSFVGRLRLFFKQYKTEIALVIGSYAVYSLFLKSKFTEQGAVQSVSTTRDFKKFERDTVMMMPTQQVNRSWAAVGEVKHAVVRTAGVGEGDLCSLIAGNHLKGTSHHGTKKASCVYALALDNETILINKHYLTFNESYKEEGVIVSFNGIDQTVFPRDIKENPNSEAVCIPNVYGPFKNIRKYISPQDKSFYRGIVIHRDDGNSRHEFKRSTVTLNGQTYPSYFTTSLESEPGDCGSVLILTEGGQSYIGGFLFAKRMGGYFTKPEIHFTDVWIPEEYTAQGAYSDFVYERIPDLKPISNASEQVKHETAYFLPIGSSGKPTNSFRSQVVKTDKYDHFSQFLSEEFVPPKDIGGKIGDQYKSAWTNTFSNFHWPCEVSYTSMIAAADDYVSDIIENSKQPILRPLWFEEAIKGQLDAKVDKIKFDTSAGKYWKDTFGFRKKTDLFSDDGLGNLTVDPNFEQSVYDKLELLDEGIVVSPLVHLVPKDEVREKAKIDNYKIRLFCVHDADYNTVLRMYCMPIVNFLLYNKEASECHGQMNAAGKEWTRLVEYLREVGDNFSDLDFSAFDTSHSYVMFKACAHVFCKLAIWCGYTEKEAQVTAWCVESLTSQLAVYKEDYFIKGKGMSSGVMITLILNSIVNSLLLRCAFRELVPNVKFREHVRCATVGDDNVLCISDDVIELFNMVDIAPLYASWGYKVTPASKDGEFVKKMALEDLVFLKRKFVLWDDGFYRAPLAPDSLYKALCFERKDGLRGLERLIGVYMGACREAYLHGEEFFNEFVTNCQKGFEVELPHFSFQQLNEEFLEKGITTDWA